MTHYSHVGLLGSDTRASTWAMGTHAYPNSRPTGASQSHQTRHGRPGTWVAEKCNRFKRQRKELSKRRGGGEQREREAGRQVDFYWAPFSCLSGRSATFPERGSKSSRDVDLWRFTPFPSVKLLAESADWLQQGISHQCSLIVFCKQNACCLVTFHLSLTFPESYCYQIRFTLSSCDYCNLLNPGVHPSGKEKLVV